MSPNQPVEFIVEPSDQGQRLDHLLCERLEDYTRSHIQRWIETGQVLVSDLAVKAGYRVKAGQRISVTVPPAEPIEVMPEDIPLNFVYEDEWIAVINKPQGMVVHPAAGNASGTLVNALLFHCRDLSGINGMIRPGIVHRLDKDTSGLLVVAKNDQAHVHLSAQIQSRRMHRRYQALVWGHPAKQEGTIDAPIGRHPIKRKQMDIVAGGKPAITHYQILEQLKGAAWIQADLETGRTHQIRVHMASIGHPLLGDPLYANKPFMGLDGQALHAISLTLLHPKDEQEMNFHAPLPAWFEQARDSLHIF